MFRRSYDIPSSQDDLLMTDNDGDDDDDNDDNDNNDDDNDDYDDDDDDDRTIDFANIWLFCCYAL